MKTAFKTAGFTRDEAAEVLKTTTTTIKDLEENKGERAQLINRAAAFALEHQPDYSDTRERFCAVRILGEIGGLSKHVEDMTDLEIDRLTRKIACMIRFRGNH